MTFGQAFRRVRLDRGVGLEWLAEEAGFNFSNLAKIERGRRKPMGLALLYKMLLIMRREDHFEALAGMAVAEWLEKELKTRNPGLEIEEERRAMFVGLGELYARRMMGEEK